MQFRTWLLGSGLALIGASGALAATITHDSAAHFQNGISSGAATVVYDRNVAATGARNAGVGIVPTPGTAVMTDEFSYASASAAETAGWRFLLPNQQPAQPSTFSVTDSPGAVRIRASRPQDIHNTNETGQQSPVLFVNNRTVSGDFIAETKLTFQEPRQDERNQGLIVLPYSGDPENPVTIDNETRYFYAGPHRVQDLVTSSRLYPNGQYSLGPTEVASGVFPSTTWIVRIVKRGSYFYSFMRENETAPWVFHQWIKLSDLAPDASTPLVLGVYAKSWGGVNATNNFQTLDFDYFRVWRIGEDTGTYTNVIDAGAPADWQVAYPWTISMQGLRYQLRAGNTLANGSLTDAGSFVGPDSTANTFFEDDAAQTTPFARNARYLEYKLFLDNSVTSYPGVEEANLPAVLLQFSGVFQPAGLSSIFANNGAEFGAGSGAQVQTGDGDVSLARTQVYRDDFTAPTLGAGWTFTNRAEFTDPAAVAEYSLTERPGVFRMKVGYRHDLFLGTKFEGVSLLRNLPVSAANVEVEAEVNMETQQGRMAGLVLWQDENNWVGLTVSRRFGDFYTVGTVADVVVNNTSPTAQDNFYGSNRIQMRVTKVGSIVTLAHRDAASPSPSWRVVAVVNMGDAFNPTQGGFLGKSYANADRNPQNYVNYDYEYFQVSTLALNGTQDIPLTVPAGSRPDIFRVIGDGVSVQSTRAQVRNASGTFVGPDGTAATFFTANEARLPEALAGVTNPVVRLVLDATTPAGVPYIHALGIQYATGALRVARDTNASDFQAGTGTGLDRSVAGQIGGATEYGAITTENFNSTPSNWLFSNTPSNNSSVNFDTTPGFAEITMGRPEDLWVPGTATQKPRIFLYNGTPVSGNFELETRFTIPERQPNRHFGLGIVPVLPGGAAPDANLDMENFILFGPYQTADMLMARMLKNPNGDDSATEPGARGGWGGTSYYLMVRKIGQTFFGYAKATATAPWTQIVSETNPQMQDAQLYVGFLGKSWPADAPAQLNVAYDYFTYRPIVATIGTYTSRVLDMGGSGYTPLVDTQGNSAAVQLRFRSADTPEALDSQPFVGPDGTTATSFAGNFNGTLPVAFAKRYVQYQAVVPVGSVLTDIALIGVPSTVAPFTRADVLTALRIAGGLEAGQSAQVTRLDVVKGTSAGRVDLLDAVQILRSVQ